MQCNSCREEIKKNTTWWERTRYNLMKKLFHTEVLDLIQEKYTQGCADGFKMGYDEAWSNAQKSVQQHEDLIKGVYDAKKYIETEGLFKKVPATETKKDTE